MVDSEKLLVAKTGKPFVDLLRTRYWASFTTIEVLVENLGCTREDLLELMARYAWELQKPPALRLQNKPLSTPPIAGPMTVTDFVRNERGEPSRTETTATIEPGDEHVRITFECHEPDMASLRQAAGTTAQETDPFNVGVWEAHFGEWDGEWQWWTERVREAAAAGKLDELIRRARGLGPRPYSAFEDDCVIVALTPVHIGDDTNYLDVTRYDPHPRQLARELKRPGDCRLYQPGTFYLIAVNPRGVGQETYFDPWEDGFFWPSWRSGVRVEAQQGDRIWRVVLTIPFRNLEPLMDSRAVWGVDLFRRKPGRDEREYARARETVFFQYRGEPLAPKYWNVTYEDQRRHMWVPAVVPHVLETIERPEPETTATFLARDLPDDEWPTESDWPRAECVGEFFDNRTGRPACARTEVQLLFDPKRLYVRFVCFEPRTDQLQVVTREQEEAEYSGHLRADFLFRRCEFGMGWGDFVEVMLAPSVNNADKFHGGFYDLVANSQGMLLESRHDAFGMVSLREGDQWRSGSRVAVEARDDRWIAQLAIPFESLRGVESAGEVWHLNLLRMRAAKPGDPWRELSAWAPTHGWPRDNLRPGKRNPRRLGRLRLPGADFASWAPHAPALTPFVGRPEDGRVEGRPRDRSRDALGRVCFVDGQYGWAVGGFGTILHSRDGGARWEEQHSGAGYVLESVTFADERRGWSVGGWLRDKAVATLGGMGIILATSDAGEHWRTQWEGKGAWLYDVCFVDERVGWACGENGTVLKTEDGGETWSLLPTTDTLDTLHSICFVDRRHGWAGGENETVLVTRDGGRSWKRALLPRLPRALGMRNTFNAVCAVDEHCAWVVGTEGTILHTTNGGETWQLHALGIDPRAAAVFDLTDVCFVGERCGWIVGAIGSAIFRTEDAGRTWEPVPMGIGQALWDVHFVDAQEGWAVGERGARLRTTDAGRTWRVEAMAAELPGFMYVTAHPHHMNSVAGVLAALGAEHEVTCVFSGGVPEDCRAAAWSIGAWQVRALRGFIGGRRRAPGRLHHHYQTKRGLEPLERRMTAMIRALRPEAILCEWPIMDEGYWAGEPAFTARAVVRAFESAGDPGRFPELSQLGLAPWRPSRLYHVGHYFNDLYRVHPANDVLDPGDQFVPTLGMPAREAAYRQSRCWRGLLDRGESRRAVGPLRVHLRIDRASRGEK